MGYIFGYFFPFFYFSIYLVIFYVDLGRLTFVIGDFGVFLGFWGFNCSRASFRGIESDYPVDLRAVVVSRSANKFLGFFSFFV